MSTSPASGAVVTGATSGLGVETARALAAAGAEVLLGVRRLDAGRKVAQELRHATGNDAIEAAPVDLSDLASVSAFARAWKGPLHILINNTESWRCPSCSAVTWGVRCIRKQLPWPFRARRRTAGASLR